MDPDQTAPTGFTLLAIKFLKHFSRRQEQMTFDVCLFVLLLYIPSQQLWS